MKSVAVIPTCRHGSINHFLDRWGHGPLDQHFPWDVTIVVEDTTAKKPIDISVYKDRHDVLHYKSANLTEEYGHREIWSSGNSAIRCLGFLKAMVHNPDLIITLDDDCLPGPDGPIEFVDRIKKSMRSVKRCHTYLDNVDGSQLPVRGMPFKNFGHLQSSIHMGLWHGVADLSADAALRADNTGFIPPAGIICPTQQYYWPMCSMNLAFTPDALPLMYFPRMGIASPYDRFEDIWCGYVAQRATRCTDMLFTIGDPHINHGGGSNVFENLRKEATGYAANEVFWQMLDSIPMASADPVLNLQGIAMHMGETKWDDDTARLAPDGFIDYLKSYGENLRAWAKLAREACKKPSS